MHPERISNACELHQECIRIHVVNCKTLGTSDSDNAHLSQGLINNLIFHKTLLEAGLWRSIDLMPTQRQQLVLYSDASCEPGPGPLPTVKICWIIMEPYLVGGTVTVPERVLKSFVAKKQYIAQGEALAAALALHFHGHLLEGTSALFFIDNISVLAGLTVGSSRAADLAAVLQAVTLVATKRDSLNWWEHVDSHANPSDGGGCFP